jgi:hypothetical protein
MMQIQTILTSATAQAAKPKLLVTAILKSSENCPRHNHSSYLLGKNTQHPATPGRPPGLGLVRVRVWFKDLSSKKKRKKKEETTASAAAG